MHHSNKKTFPFATMMPSSPQNVGWTINKSVASPDSDLTTLTPFSFLSGGKLLLLLLVWQFSNSSTSSDFI
jgi:hypothetical protein